MYKVWLSVLFYWLIQQGVNATLTPSGPTVSVDCGGQQTFTCSVTGAGAGWTITGLDGITAPGTSGITLAGNSNRVTTTETDGIIQTSTITVTGFTGADIGGTVQCINLADSMVQGMATVSIGPPQCGTVGVVQGNGSCPSFTFTPQGNVLPSTAVVVSYQLVGDPSSAGSLNCDYPVDPQMCELLVPEGTYNIRATLQNSCGSPSSTCSSTVTVNVSPGCEPVITSPSPDPVSLGVIVGAVIGGVAAMVIVGVSGWCITILIMSCTCFASLGFLALLKCLCCPCCKGTARKSSSKHRHMRNESTVTLTNPPADEYADPQSSRDRKEKDRDKIQYADLEFYSRGTIHQKEQPVTYTDIHQYY